MLINQLQTGTMLNISGVLSNKNQQKTPNKSSNTPRRGKSQKKVINGEK
jgi:hypothetical protein